MVISSAEAPGHCAETRHRLDGEVRILFATQVSVREENGEPAIGLAIGMRQNANVLEFGEHLKAHMKRVVADLPVGIRVHLVSDQPKVVDDAVFGFVEALFEAVAIVLVVSLFWGPMAYAMMGGIIVGTLLTLLFLPALYVARFRVRAPASTSAEATARS